ncbi:MAG: type II toxin-antitoxin system HicB family antitoxin [Candidatus Gracilibacteria bacterium]|nr:type II toxin-antitoxin system HicB family antitoxin [Candidatus Gracilibacteria bacterium]MDQ7022354.1 type II toxin-antitoxin system HicB family antitoxin [Candidatus Gracilibacteria bacterium]
MINFTAFIEREGNIFIAKNLEFGIFSQGNTSDEAVLNLKEATTLYMEDESKETLLSKFKNKQYSLTMLTI